MKSELSTRPANEVVAEIDALLEAIHDDASTFEENTAVHAPDDGLTTDLRAIAALERPERFPGEHLVARMWLQNSETTRIWYRNGSE